MFKQTYDGVKRVLTSNVGVTGKLSQQKNGDKTFGPVSIALMVLAGGGGTGYVGLQTLESPAFALATTNATELAVLQTKVTALETNQFEIKDAIGLIRTEQREDFRDLAKLIREIP